MSGSEAAFRLLWSLAVGAMLGLCYGFLRPVRGKLTWLSDLIFVLAAGYGWLYVGFGVCGGDLRFGCTAAMAVGGVVWDRTAGKLLQRIFCRFWTIIDNIWGFFRKALKSFFKKIQKIINFLLASGKKCFTIKRTIRKERPTSGGNAHGKKKSRHQAGIQKVQPHHKSRAVGGRGAVHHRTGDTARLNSE